MTKSKFVIRPKSLRLSAEFDFVSNSNPFWEIVGDRPDFIFHNDDKEIFIYGDCLNCEVSAEYSEISAFLKNALGHFTIIINQNNHLTVSSSYFSFLPIYYTSNQQFISNHWGCIAEYSKKEISETFIIESHLFNYSIGNRTLYADVFLADSFGAIELKQESFEFRQIERVEGWFVDKIDSAITLNVLANKFNETCKDYFTNEKELITFTSGFDGRTILANALANHKPVHTFSVGRMHNIDVTNPAENAIKLGINYEPIDLADEEYSKSFFENACDLSQLGGGGNGFLYPHLLFCAKKYKDYGVMHTGFCGSELFRALHIAGAVTTSEMVAIFLVIDEDALYNLIFKSKRLGFLKPEMVNRNKEIIWKEIQELRFKRSKFNNTNHFFYYFIFKEVFRKIFGFNSNAMFEFVKVRTPFLDFRFVELLLKSEFAGCNNDFFTHNPLKRYKGQLLYAKILKNLKSPLYKIKTGKGYKPSQLLSFFGQLTIALPYLKKELKKKSKNKNIDNLFLCSGFSNNWNEISKNLKAVEAYYDIQEVFEIAGKMHPAMSEIERDMLFQLASLAVVLQKSGIYHHD